MLTALKATYQKYERWIPIATFLLGFLFDTAMLRRIDEPKVIVQQAIYLLISAVLIGVELVEETRGHQPETAAPKKGLAKLSRYREPLLHFLLGTLLNSYTIFYFKSASSFSSFAFIFLLVVLLTMNEFKRFGKSQTQVHAAFLSLCLVSYFVSLAPILLGFLGVVPFLCAVVASLACSGAFYGVLKSKLAKHPEVIRTHIILPFAAIQGLFVILYFAHLIPPVPLSVKYLGIYHGAQKLPGGDYDLTYTRSSWKFWQHGDQTFAARPGDTIYCYAQVFSPTRFKDELQIRWLYHDERRGWQPSDAIPMAVQGGREEGYRMVTKKSNFQPGEWRVQVETRDDRVVGSIGFEVETDDSTGEREFSHDSR